MISSIQTFFKNILQKNFPNEIPVIFLRAMFLFFTLYNFCGQKKSFLYKKLAIQDFKRLLDVTIKQQKRDIREAILSEIF